MKKKILYIERKYWGFVSIEKVFEQISENISREKFDYEFLKVKYGNNLTGILKNLLFFRRPKADIYHITGHIHYMALVLPTKNTVLTIHDVGFLHLRKGLRRYIIKKLFLDLPVHKLKYITAISETTKKEIVAQTNCPPEKIRVIENPLRKQFLSSENKIFNKENPVILQVGTLPNKNVKNLIRALSGIRCRLRLIGLLDADLIDELKAHKISYESTYELDDDAMKDEYVKADMVSFCSTYEGFGLPIIEAQAMQTPVITSNLSPMKEVAGKGACLADPYNTKEIRNGILKIIESEDYRQKIISRGMENVVRFEPRMISDLYEKLYLEILSHSD